MSAAPGDPEQAEPKPAQDRSAHAAPALTHLDWSADALARDAMGFFRYKTRSAWISVLVFPVALLCMPLVSPPGAPAGAPAGGLYSSSFLLFFAIVTPLFMGLQLGPGLLEWFAALRARRALEKSSTADVFTAASITALARSPFSCPLDVRRYFQEAGPVAPRVIIPRGATAAPLAIPKDLFEELDLGAGRQRGPIAKRSQQQMLMAAGLMLLFMAMGTISAGLAGMTASRALGFLVPIGLVAVTLLGSRGLLIPMTSEVASIGKVSTCVYGRDADFTRDDSVMMLSESTKQVVVMFVRDDGRTHTQIFEDGWSDPSLAALIVRWSYPVGRRAPDPDIEPSTEAEAPSSASNV